MIGYIILLTIVDLIIVISLIKLTSWVKDIENLVLSKCFHDITNTRPIGYLKEKKK